LQGTTTLEEATVARLRVHAFTLSLDGYAAGPNQRADAPMGDGREGLHDWMMATRYFHGLSGQEGGTTGPDDDEARVGFENIGATIMGRNMFGPVRGPWPDHSWTGWWGPNPPYHHDVFVMTHHPRPDLEMEGGTTFHFVDASPEKTLELAVDAAGGQDVRLGGGVSTVQQFLAEGLVDEMHLVVSPILIGAGERLLDGPLPGYRLEPFIPSETVLHARVVRA
jgi:dihydrofolate reductase